MSLLDDIKEKQRELEDLRKEYSRVTPPCTNTKCGFWKQSSTGQCSWTHLIEDCKDYKSEEPEEECTQSYN